MNKEGKATKYKQTNNDDIDDDNNNNHHYHHNQTHHDINSMELRSTREAASRPANQEFFYILRNTKFYFCL
jgi:hypothetical protein